MSAPAAPVVRILLVSGSTRQGSTNTAALRAVRAAGIAGLTADLHDGLAGLPAFDPDDDGDAVPSPVADLRRRIAAADGVLFCTPEYAGGLPGSFKNLLDWTVGGGQLHGKPVAWINVAAPGRGEGAHADLATVLGYVGAVVVEDACVRVNVPRGAVDGAGEIGDPEVREGLARAAGTFALRLAERRDGSVGTSGAPAARAV